MTTVFDTPSLVLQRLEEIDRDLAVRLPGFEAAALAWFHMKRDREHARAVAFMSSSGTVAERNAQADIETSLMGKNEEALYMATKAVMDVLSTRSTIGMALLKAQGVRP